MHKLEFALDSVSGTKYDHYLTEYTFFFIYITDGAYLMSFSTYAIPRLNTKPKIIKVLQYTCISAYRFHLSNRFGI